MPKYSHSKWLNCELSLGKWTETLLLTILLKLICDLGEAIMPLGEAGVWEV